MTRFLFEKFIFRNNEEQRLWKKGRSIVLRKSTKHKSIFLLKCFFPNPLRNYNSIEIKSLGIEAEIIILQPENQGLENEEHLNVKRLYFNSTRWTSRYRNKLNNPFDTTREVRQIKKKNFQNHVFLCFN